MLRKKYKYKFAKWKQQYKLSRSIKLVNYLNKLIIK